MSSPASVVTRIELPGLLLSEKLGLALGVASGVLLECLAPRYPGFPQGSGLALAAVLAFLQLGFRTGLSAIEWDGLGRFRVRFRDGRLSEARIGYGTRLLGGTVYLDLAMPPLRRLRVWLLPQELGPEARRSLVLGLRRALADGPAVRRFT